VRLVGVLGGGQLGRMLALAGIPLDIRFRFLDHARDACARDVGEMVVGEFDDRDALRRLSAGCDVVTYEFENVPAKSVRVIDEAAGRGLCLPGSRSLEVTQDRLSEKRLFEECGAAVVAHEAVDSREEMRAAAARIGLPAVLKTRRLGYDGKGQVLIRDDRELDQAWNRLESAAGRGGLILERFIAFRREVSMIAARFADGSSAFFPLTENVHRDGILHTSRVRPQDRGSAVERSAEAAVQRVMEALGHVGVLTVEFFETDEGLLANEFAPRVHNSGHWTIEGAEVSQFEMHLRAIGAAPGSSAARAPARISAIGHAAMVNLVGRVPDVKELLEVRGARVHLYGKEPRAGRKLGHVTIRAESERELEASLARVRHLVGGP